jgi:hypothetical protein
MCNRVRKAERHHGLKRRRIQKVLDRGKGMYSMVRSGDLRRSPRRFRWKVHGHYDFTKHEYPPSLAGSEQGRSHHEEGRLLNSNQWEHLLGWEGGYIWMQNPHEADTQENKWRIITQVGRIWFEISVAWPNLQFDVTLHGGGYISVGRPLSALKSDMRINLFPLAPLFLVMDLKGRGQKGGSPSEDGPRRKSREVRA